MSLSFSHLWKQQEHSDVDVVLWAPSQHSRDKLVLMKLPAHSALLSNSEVYRAKLLRWQEDRDPSRRCSKYARSSSTDCTARTEIELELQDTSEQEAALAVLQSLYAVKPLPELLAELSQEQQLQAAVLADKWAVPHISSAAAQLLVNAVKADGGLATAVQQRVLQDSVLPECLQPVLKSVLLALLGDLEAVWADHRLQDTLLGLPLHAMELLLSCDELKVASEDTVLYTAERYLDFNQTSSTQSWQQRAKERLALLIRCPHLSHYWLSGSVNSHDTSTMLLAELRPHVRQLLMLRDAKSDYLVTSADLQEGQPLVGAPSSWAMESRVFKPVSSVAMVWHVDVSELRDAARNCARGGRTTQLSSRTSPPLGGIAFNMLLECVSLEAGVEVGFFCQPFKLAVGMYSMFNCMVEVVGCETMQAHARRPNRSGRGWSNFFGVTIEGGWDELAWASKGLPINGELTIKVTVSGVPHVASR